jgi:formylglycine-generating enzyme required for sulfatase activity
MVGNVWAWTEDCYHDSYNGAPTDGSAWTSGNCGVRVLRGGAWFIHPANLRSAERYPSYTDLRTFAGVTNVVGFRVGRTLLTP